MEITQFVLDTRRELLDYEDYGTYASKLATRLKSTRKRLGVADKNPAKHKSSLNFAPAKIAENHELVHIPLLIAEGRWANAMHYKARDVLTGDTRTQIISKLVRAYAMVDRLVESLADKESGATTLDVLDARAYAAMIRGAADFQKKHWREALESYSTAKVLYIVLAAAKGPNNTMFKDLETEVIDVSMRFIRQKLDITTSISVEALAKKHFPQSNADLVSDVKKVDPNVFEEDVAMSDDGSALRTLAWRSRKVQIQDAEIALKWDALEEARAELSEKLGSIPDSKPNRKADAYDGVLEASQNAVDETQLAIDDLKAHGVTQDDERVQNLAVIRTKLNYEMLSWRIGRNRVMMGNHDGALAGVGPTKKGQADSPSAQLKQLKDKAKLYDLTLQSLVAAKELPGVANDDKLAADLDANYQYFMALKSLAIARGHTLTGGPTKALALAKYAVEQCDVAMPILTGRADPPEGGPKNINVTKEDGEFLHRVLKGELQRSASLVEIANLRAANKSGPNVVPPPLAGRLSSYPADGLNLEGGQTIVKFPPTLEPIPVKPLFLDSSWNYIKYSKGPDAEKKEPDSAKPAPAKKGGWFGFGRR